MSVHQRGVGEGLFAAMLTLLGVVRQLKLEPQPLMHNMEHRHDAVQHVDPNTILPHGVQALLHGTLAHYFSSGIALIQLANDRGRFGQVTTILKRERWRLSSGIHF